MGLKVLAAIPSFWVSVFDAAKPDLILGEVPALLNGWAGVMPS
jgi:hypothetical protein